MKKIVNSKDLQTKMQEAINLLCGTVKTTLGPKGSNIIIDHSSFTPFITNDGVTIAENIASDDPIINTILELAKEASIKTNETVGDGTTTTLVLLESIFNEGLKLIQDGLNPIILKKELLSSLNTIIPLIKYKSHLPNNNELSSIASISANSKDIGKIITDAFLKVKNKSAILVKEGCNEETTINYLKGYSIDTLIPNSYFFKDQDTINLTNSKILITNNYLSNIEEIAEILNNLMTDKTPLLIVADDYSDNFTNDIIALSIQENLNIILLKASNYGTEKLTTLNDLALINNSKVTDTYSYKDLGIIKEVKISKDTTTFYFTLNSKIKDKIKELKTLKTSSDLDKDFLNKRLAMLNTGLIEILVGDKTITARREKKMRYDDALCAIATATKGVSLGSGITLYQISEELQPKTNADKILINALKVPFKEIMYNSGLDSTKIINEIKNSNYQKIYNVVTEKYEDVNSTTILDPTEVIINSLTYAISIASMLLTTTSLVINEYPNNLSKVNDYNEL